VDTESTRDVIRGRDDTPTVRITADDERHRPQSGVLQLFDGREEGVQVEMRDDHN
jgi:hypothetical protein